MRRQEEKHTSKAGQEFVSTGEIISDEFKYKEKRRGEAVEYSQYYFRPDKIILSDGSICDDFDALQIVILNNREKICVGQRIKIQGVFQQSPWMTFEDGAWFKLQDCIVHKIKLKG